MPKSKVKTLVGSKMPYNPSWLADHFHPYLFCKRFGLETKVHWMCPPLGIDYDGYYAFKVMLVTIVAGERCYLRGWFSNN